MPKPTGPLPMLVTGFSRQSLEWIAAHSDGWITYPRSLEQQAEVAARWRAAVSAAAPGAFKPFAQSLYVDLTDDPDGSPEPIHLGFRAGRNFLFRYLDGLRAAGVHHVGLNFKYGLRGAAENLEEIGREILPRIEATQPTDGAGTHGPSRSRASRPMRSGREAVGGETSTGKGVGR